MLMDILTFIAFFALGWFLGRQVLLFSLRSLISDYAESKGVNLNTNIPICVIEAEGTELYLYDRDTKAFYCQAPTIAELAINLQKNKNINTAFAVQIIDDTPKVWMFKEGKYESAQ